KYSLFWIEDDFSQYFYHKGILLCQFFLEYIRTNSKHTMIQYDYITNYIPHKDIHTYIIEEARQSDISVQKIQEKIQLENGDSKVELVFNNRNIDIYAESLLSAEKVVFPILRNFESSFFIIGKDQNEYGWISPFIGNELKLKNERLYSFL